MNSETLFSLALGLQPPWEVKEVKFVHDESKQKELHLRIGFVVGARFADEAGNLCGVYDTVERKWRHLNFFEHACYLHCAVPLIKTSSGNIVNVAVPWARANSGFTLLFEALALAMIEREMPVNRVAELMQVNPQRIWTIFNHWVGKALQADDPSDISQIGIDETSTRKGHNYVTVGVDMESERVIYVSEGKGKQAVQTIGKHLQSKGAQVEQIQQVGMDLSPAFIAGVKDTFPCAQITFDRFHIVKLLNEAMDAVRKAERREHDALKGHKYTFLKKPESLSETQQQQITNMIRLYPTLGEAYRLKILFNDLWSMPDKHSAHAFLTQWCEEVNQAGILSFQAFAKTVTSHWDGIIHFVESRLTNGILEGINNKIQLAKRRARGYRNINNFINMIYFLCGKLRFTYPRYFT